MDRSHSNKRQFPCEIWEVRGSLLTFGEHVQVISEIQRPEVREVKEEHQQTVQCQRNVPGHQHLYRTANGAKCPFHRGRSELLEREIEYLKSFEPRERGEVARVETQQLSGSKYGRPLSVR